MEKYKLVTIVLILIGIIFTPIISEASEIMSLYEIEKEDTLYKISNEYDVELNKLIKANNLPNPNLVYPGQKVTIPHKTLGLEKIEYIVKQGDTLYKISQKFNINIAEIKRLNNVESHIIYPGEILIITPDSKFINIDVDISEQTVRVYFEDILVKEMITSSGMIGYDTPLGNFEIQNRGEWFYSYKYQEGAKYWVSFLYWGKYLFHTVPMDKDKNIIPEEAEKLGRRASHGCLRLKVEDAKWIYDNIPIKAKVYIHK
ncbi:L,D-transpeptidase [Thermohalobacter berrensis]|uniref:LysM domain-containing protein n=1 Tax=Thermohalobacter berrensis TaxID=99594 RepID=A0A419SWE1_9FIRM|nr:L,D-transpeptidase [Thermohalobacter berrensis]RKD29548.1 hypothetical protein BET03_05680 [Thermohalobacter berrensis]